MNKPIVKYLCTGCGRDRKNKIDGSFLSCCPDAKYKKHVCFSVKDVSDVLSAGRSQMIVKEFIKKIKVIAK